MLSKYFNRLYYQSQSRTLQAYSVEKSNVINKLEESEQAFDEINDQIAESEEELQRIKFWLYVANNELEKEKLSHKLQVQGIHKYRYKMEVD